MDITQTQTLSARFSKLDRDVTKEARASVQQDGIIISALENVLDWFRTKIKDFLIITLGELPIVGQWAQRISTSIVEFLFAVVQTILKSIGVIFTSPEFWQKAHQAAMVAWDHNEGKGLLAQTYAYSKKMSGYLLEIFKQCLERAIKAQGLEVSDEDKDDISKMLDDYML